MPTFLAHFSSCANYKKIIQPYSTPALEKFVREERISPPPQKILYVEKKTSSWKRCSPDAINNCSDL
jgi:hypothetical protein